MDSHELQECFHCGEEFSSATDFKIHLKTHTKTAAPSPGGVVDLTDNGPGDVVDLTDKGGEPHECYHCGEGFYSIPDLDNHMKIHDTARNQTVINTPSDDTGGFVDLTEDGEDPHECFHCGEEFGSEDLLNSHLVTRHQVKPHRCVQCGDGFMQDYQLKAHELTHKEISQKVMSDVKMMYRSYTNNTRPSTSAHKEEEDTTSASQTEHECTHCGKCFSSVSALGTHKLMHSAKQGNKCTFCSKTFTSRYDLKRHLVRHTGEKAHSCHLCPKMYSQTSALYLHMRQSHRTQPFICPFCGEGFAKMADFRVHKKSHPEDESYVASHKKPYLSRSIEEEDLYACVQCGDSFKEKTDLDVHSEIHVRDTLEISPQSGNGNLAFDPSHKCPRCSTMFGEEAELNSHIITCIPSVQDLNTHIKEENSSVHNLIVNNLGVVDLTLDDDDDDDELDQHKCAHCDKSFRLKGDLNAHLIMFHPTPDSHECFHCGEEFDIENDLKLHILTTHESTGLKHQTEAELQTHKDTQQKKQRPALIKSGMSSQQTEDTRSSNKVRQYKCLQCDQSFTSKQKLYKHCQIHLDTTAYKCYCGMQFSNLDSLEKHKETHSDIVDLTFDEDETYKCSLCDDVYSREEELIVHMMTHPKQEPFECPECGKKFVFEKDYQFHLQTHVKAESSKKGHVCSDCGKAFSQMGELKKHLLTHTGDKPHQCPVCQKRFASLVVLHRHEATHGAEPHKCQHCGAGFWQTYYLQRHLEKECSRLQQGTALKGNLHGLPIKKETYTCCGWSFMSEADMKVHELSHKVTVYKCMQCMQVFRSPADLETHTMTHTEASSPHKVAYQDSSTSSMLMAASTNNIEDEHHRCLQCGKEFRTKAFLNKHLQLHKADKCHRCNQCGQKFLSLAGLSKHALTHADKKPNQCPVCNDNFNNSAKLFEHMAKHESSKTHSCTQCGKTFKRSASLKSHMRMHNEEYGGDLEGDPSENVDMWNIHASNVRIPNIHTPLIRTQIIDTPNNPRPNIREPNGARPTPSRMDFSHVRQEEEEEEEQDPGHMCTFCGRKFKHEKHLKSHFRTHMKSTSSTYYETKVKFADAAGKELRIVTRIRKKRCKCYICYKMFRRPSDLARHMMIHTGERPCKCAFCPEGFILLWGLKKHTMKFHKDIPPQDEDQIRKNKEEADSVASNAKKAKKAKNIGTIRKYGRLPGYLCCGIRFMTYLEIQHHWLVHKEEERYACPHCELRFTKGFSRTKHIMRMHSGTNPNCLDCGKEFTQFQDLIAHMKTHEAQLDDEEPASTNRVEVYTDVADGEQASTSRVEVYTDVADAGSVLVKTEIIPDEEDEEDPDAVPVLPRLDNILHTTQDSLKREAGQDSELDLDIEVDPTDPEVDPIALKKEVNMETTDDPSSPIDDAVLDSEPEETPTLLKKEVMMDTDPDVSPSSPTDNAVPDTAADVAPSSPNISIKDSLPPVPPLINQYRCLHCGEKFSERGHLIPHVGNHVGRNYSSCNACKMGFLRKEELQVHLATHFMYPS